MFLENPRNCEKWLEVAFVIRLSGFVIRLPTLHVYQFSSALIEFFIIKKRLSCLLSIHHFPWSPQGQTNNLLLFTPRQNLICWTLGSGLMSSAVLFPFGVSWQLWQSYDVWSGVKDFPTELKKGNWNTRECQNLTFILSWKPHVLITSFP